MAEVSQGTSGAAGSGHFPYHWPVASPTATMTTSQAIHEHALATPDKPAMIYGGTAVAYEALDRAIAAARGHFVARRMSGAGYVAIVDRNLLNGWVLGLALRDVGLTTIAVPSLEALDTLALPGLRGAVSADAGTPVGPWEDIERACARRGIPALAVSLASQSPMSLAAARGSFPIGGNILLTSGTTGQSKPVLMSPTADRHHAVRLIDVLRLGHDACIATFHLPLWTAVGHRWPGAAWRVGGTVVIDQRPDVHLPLTQPGLTHAVLTPGLLDAVLAAPPEAFAPNPALHLSVTGGAMTRGQVGQALARISPRLYSWLASTEAGGLALTPIARAEDQRWHTLIAGRVVEVVDEQDRRLPPGVAGRVRVATDGGADGYLDDPPATHAFFRDGYFYPGDIGILGDDGRLALQGRTTEVINLGGSKMAPGPIEERLGERLGVARVCLFSWPNAAGEEEAHLVIERDTPLAHALLADAVTAELHGVPRVHYHYVPAFPRNAQGKIVRGPLRAAIATAAAAGTANVDVPRQTPLHHG